jgi:hypothetical protein
MTKSKIIVDLLENREPLSRILLRLSALLYELNNEQIRRWVDYEISGYPFDQELPDYRIIKGVLKGTIVSGFTIWQDQDIPVQPEDPKMDEITSKNCRESVTAIENVILSKDDQFYCPLPPAANKYIAPRINGQIQSLKLVITKHSFIDVHASIEKKVLDILLTLESEIGNLDSYDLQVNEKKKEKISSTIINIIFTDNSIKIGNGNTIKKSTIDSNITGAHTK